MEAKNVKVISLMVIVMLGSFAEKSLAQSAFTFTEICYVGCLVRCGITHRHDREAIFLQCPMDCLKECIFPWSTPTDKIAATSQEDHYCKFGCAALNCIKGSTPKDPRGYQVERCVNSFCSNKCTN
ncbi:hypothetical protein MKX03_025711 [Papaver bracteatum]|nr:hypothetical protein MKX03_025711 [Papaver bracteatum]